MSFNFMAPVTICSLKEDINVNRTTFYLLCCNGCKIDGRNINNLRYADNTTLMAESEEELRSLLMKQILMKVKEENENVGLSSTFRKLRSWHLVPSLHGK